MVIYFSISANRNIEAEKTKKGNDPGAPEDPKLKKKFIYTTLFALLVWTIIFITIKISNYEV